MRVLVVEDELAISSAIRSILESAGHAADVADDGPGALDWAGMYRYDLVILDVILPGMDGVAVCRALRAQGSKTPILMLTALDAIEDRVTGLDAGADDYLAKPFAAAELLARVRALRRRGVGEAAPLLRVGDLELDPASREVLVANLDYVARQTANPAISFVLASSSDDPSAAALGRRLGSGWVVSDLQSVTSRLANSVTSVDLTALVSLDVGFAIVIASFGVALFLLAGLSERRRELATLAAIGAEPTQLGAVVAGETSVIGVAGVAAGVVTGGLVGVTLLGILAGVFDPPADLPNLPLVAIGLVTLTVVVGLVVANLVAAQAMRRIDVLAALRER